MDVTYKPLTKKQRQELEGYVSPAITIFRAVVFAGAMLIVGAICRVIVTSAAAAFPLLDHAAWWAVPTLAFGIWLYRVAGRWTGGSGLRARIRADLKRGELAARRVVAVEAIEIEEQEDEGPGFLVRTADGQTMLFAGQYLEPFVRRGFPWTAFDILEAPESLVFIGISSAGDKLKPSVKRGPLSWEESKAFGILNAKYVVVDRDFDSLK
jgi:hypothetical protein